MALLRLANDPATITKPTGATFILEGELKADAEQYSRDPYPVTWELEHPRATVKPTGDGRWRTVLWEEPGVVMADHVHNGEVTFDDQESAIAWAIVSVEWERKVRR